MFVTLELLRKHNASEQGIKYIERFYPNGAEVIDIIRDRHISKEFLHWGREHFTTNAEELAAYCIACDIVNSESFWYSQNIHESKYVSKSKNIFNSSSIFESQDIDSSKDIVSSENIENSNQIFFSSMIDTSQKIYKGINITESTNVCNSTMVARSTSVIDSFNVFDSSEIVNCISVSNSHFCRDCKNIKHCMFCEGFGDAEYCIFNVPIDKDHYEMIEKQYQKYLKELLAFVRDWPEELAINEIVLPTKKFDDWYHPISEKFWKWARTLPFYDSMLLYKITMNPEILID